MNLNFKNLPVGSLPYEDIQLCKKMMLRLYEKIPFLPELPLIDPNDEVFHRTINNFPGIKFVDNKLLITDNNIDDIYQIVNLMDKIYNSEAPYDIDMFSSDTPFFYMYNAILKRIKPKFTVVNLVGPFTLANSIFNVNATVVLNNLYKDFIVYLITIKALWFINKIKESSPDTKPLIIFDERLLYRFGTLKRTNDNITEDTVISLFNRVFSKLRKEGAYIGVQSFEKCNWQLLFDADCVDMISIDAYQNPSNLNILAKSVNKFLAKGGYINWGIVPVTNEKVIRSLNINNIQERFLSTLDNLSAEGVSMDLLLNNSTVSVQGDLSKYPLIFAEKALIIANKLSAQLSGKTI